MARCFKVLFRYACDDVICKECSFFRCITVIENSVGVNIELLPVNDNDLSYIAKTNSKMGDIILDKAITSDTIDLTGVGVFEIQDEEDEDDLPTPNGLSNLSSLAND